MNVNTIHTHAHARAHTHTHAHKPTSYVVGAGKNLDCRISAVV